MPGAKRSKPPAPRPAHADKRRAGAYLQRVGSGPGTLLRFAPPRTRWFAVLRRSPRPTRRRQPPTILGRLRRRPWDRVPRPDSGRGPVAPPRHASRGPSHAGRGSPVAGHGTPVAGHRTPVAPPRHAGRGSRVAGRATAAPVVGRGTPAVCRPPARVAGEQHGGAPERHRGDVRQSGTAGLGVRSERRRVRGTRSERRASGRPRQLPPPDRGPGLRHGRRAVHGPPRERGLTHLTRSDGPSRRAGCTVATAVTPQEPPVSFR